METTGIITPTRVAVAGRRNRPVSNQRLKEKSGRVNPFDVDFRQRLKEPSWSPTILSCPDNTPPQSGWTIDQLSKLNPVDIEGSPSSHQDDQELTPGSEDRIQAEILTFFNDFKDTSPFSTGVGLIRDSEQNLSFGDADHLNSSIISRRSLEFSFTQTMDTSACSDGFDIDERRMHGGYFKSPSSGHRISNSIPKGSPRVSGVDGANFSFDDSQMEV